MRYGFAQKWNEIDMYIPIGSVYGIYGNIYHQYTPNDTIYTIHGSYGIGYPQNPAVDQGYLGPCICDS